MSSPSAAVSAPRLDRDAPTLLLYAVLGVVGFLLNGLGSILGPLRRELDVQRSDVAFYPTLFALALVVVGTVGGGVVSRLGHRRALIASLLGMIGGTALLAAPARPMTLVGAAMLGSGAALSVQLVPSALTRRHPLNAAPAIGEANAVSSVASIVAPASVAAAIAVGAGWRTGYVALSLPVAAVLLAVVVLSFRPVPMRSGPAADETEPLLPALGSGYDAGPLLARWFDVVAAVSVEFCLVFWAADAFDEWHGAGDAAAPALAATFLVGMAVVRLFAAPLTRDRHPSRVVLVACAVAGLGFVGFWGTPFEWSAAVGLLVAGAGVALLYPVTLARLVAAWPDARDRAAARGALASGLAIGIAPLVLARLADLASLRAAYLVVPVIIVSLAGHAAITLARGLR